MWRSKRHLKWIHNIFPFSVKILSKEIKTADLKYVSKTISFLKMNSSILITYDSVCSKILDLIQEEQLESTHIMI